MAYITRFNTGDSSGYRPRGYPSIPVDPSRQYNFPQGPEIATVASVRQNTGVYDPNQPSRLQPDRYPGYGDDSLRKQQGQFAPEGDQKKKVCTPRCMVILGAILFVAAIVALGVVLGITLGNPTDPGKTVTVKPPASNETGPLMFRGDITLRDWKYHPDLEDPNSILYRAYNDVICGAMMARARTKDLDPVSCEIIDMWQGSLGYTYVMTFPDNSTMTSGEIEESLANSLEDMVTNDPNFVGESGPSYVDYCALDDGNSPCSQLCDSAPEGDTVVCSCYQGYTLQGDGITCQDDNECTMGTHQCEGTCTNTDGGYTCACADGSTLAEDGHNCEDMNECNVDNGGCDQTCTNTDGSFECSCIRGYALGSDGLSCLNVDDCDPDPCLNQGACVDGIDSYTCDCPDGVAGVRCELLLDASCNVTVTICPAGYRETQDNDCMDIDECAEFSPCQMRCNNTDGSYVCSCEAGMVLSTDGVSCIAMSVAIAEATYYGDRDGSLSIFCNVTAGEVVDDSVEFVWTDNTGADISEDVTERFYWLSFVMDETRLSALSLSHLAMEDSGMYTCTATYNGMDMVASTYVNVSRCYEWEHACEDKCLAPVDVCDGRLHCRDSSDERDCDCSTIFKDEYGARCEFGLCIPQKRWCNGIVDCKDGSDENEPGCTIGCPASNFKCPGEEKCIPPDHVCDAWPDCADASDELQNCQCPPAVNRWPSDHHEDRTPRPTFISYPTTPYYQSPTTRPYYRVQTGTASNSTTPPTPPSRTSTRTSTTYPPTTPSRTSTTPSTPTTPYNYYNTVPPEVREPDIEWFSCKNGQCIPGVVVCDGYADCRDGSDEEPAYCFSCPEGYEFCGPPSEIDFDRVSLKPCVLSDYVCDGKPDCYNKADERNCSSSPCQDYEFYCYLEGLCIPGYRECDGYYHCNFGEDERHCNSSSTRTTPSYTSVPSTPGSPCKDYEFYCYLEGRCIPSYQECDGYYNCNFGEDERHCNSSTTSTTPFYTGPTSTPIYPTTAPPYNGSTTSGPPCQPGQFYCYISGQCFPESYECDGYPDCTYGEDEANCGTTAGFTSGPPCQPGQFYCYISGRCVPGSYECDGYPDCPNGEDESNCGTRTTFGYTTGGSSPSPPTTPSTTTPSQCGPDERRCRNNRCIPGVLWCNNFDDCGDWSDENDCECDREKEFLCLNGGGCKPYSDFCDRVPDCVGGLDEDENCMAFCNQISDGRLKTCGTRCYSDSDVCNNYIQCPDFSDEQNCNYTCVAGEFACTVGACLPIPRWCDGIYDCLDDSDEVGCEGVCPPGFVLCEGSGPQCIQTREYCLGYTACNTTENIDCSMFETTEVCGQSLIPPRPPYKFLAGGEDAVPHSWPYTAALGFLRLGDFCGATLVSRQHLVTSAFCAKELLRMAPNIQVYLGLHNLLDQNGVQVRSAREVTVHPLYEMDESYDIAVVELISPANYTRTVQPACLPESPPPPGDTGVITGWNRTYAPQRDGDLLFYCSLESSSLCGMYTTSSSSYRWIRDSCGTPSSGTGPPYDHTTGDCSSYYLYTEASNSYRGQQTSLYLRESLLDTQSRDVILSFWYHMYGNIIGTLEVIVQYPSGTETMWNQTGEVGNYWEQATVEIRGGFDSIEFRATSKGSYEGDIALDDIMVMRNVGINGPDPEPGPASDLHQAYMPIMDRDLCKTWYSLEGQDINTVTTLCAGERDASVSACGRNDYGAGLLVEKEGSYQLQGVVSIKNTDCTPSLFTDVYHFAPWINRILGNCPSSYVQCNNTAACIAPWEFCNNIDDCGDGEDEIGCPCAPGDIQCTNGICVSPDRICDRIPDCSNMADETNCRCEIYEQRCNNSVGLCIDSRKICDQNNDCGNWEEEQQCECALNEYKCDFGPCRPLSTWCDGVPDCPDASDETPNCQDQGCPGDFFHCGSQSNSTYCISPLLVCDNSWDCPDGEDEFDCPCDEYRFQCADKKKCVYYESWCDFYQNCPDGSDEVPGCHTFCPEGLVSCNASYPGARPNCIPERLICDGFAVCPNGTDERGCPCRPHEFSCADGEKCLHYTFWCDGVPQCSDNSDETKDCPLRCPDDLRLCPHSPGDCIPERDICNFGVNCRNGEDEEGCTSCNSTWLTKCEGVDRCIAQWSVCDGIDHCGNGADERNCSCSGYRCSENGVCLQPHQLCDNRNDCGNGEDERPPLCSDNCPPWRISCNATGGCIDYIKKCDGRNDCGDWSDEVGCGPCNRSVSGGADQFRCLSGECLPHQKYCDGILDCSDGSDEGTGCESGCPSGFFLCTSNGDCIPDRFRCDTYFHCPNAEDEFDCPCPKGEFSCGDNVTCVAASRWCDGSIDCDDGIDENPACSTDCPPDFVRCNNTGTCVHPGSICDIHRDCQDWEDENDCGYVNPCGPGYVYCNFTSRCIPEYYRCDGDNDCRDNEDEQFCPCRAGQFRCADGVECENYGNWCDGYPHCADGSDELPTCRTECPPEFIPCNYTTPGDKIRCIPYQSWICDGSQYCPDGEDERGCPCPAGDFRCADGVECEDYYDWCDGYPDCRDGSDELPSCRTECPPEFIPCNYTAPGDKIRCIPYSRYICDGSRYCPDGEDEKDCPCRYPGQFKCNNTHECIYDFELCNGRPDCGDYEDELGCECTADQFTCATQHICIDQGQWCNGRFDCPDESDEPDDCVTCVERCAPNQLDCDGLCVNGSQICDGVLDCPISFADETNCDCPEAQCAMKLCIPYLALCDKKDDCPDSSDEDPLNCTAPCGDGLFECDGMCISVDRVCDGYFNCLDGTDENSCPGSCNTPRPWNLIDPSLITTRYDIDAVIRYMYGVGAFNTSCAMGLCLPYNKFCDGIVDCPDGSDESNCRMSTNSLVCPSSWFRCHDNSSCIPNEYVCDLIADCPDNSDEDSSCPCPPPASMFGEVGLPLPPGLTSIGPPMTTTSVPQPTSPLVTNPTTARSSTPSTPAPSSTTTRLGSTTGPGFTTSIFLTPSSILSTTTPTTGEGTFNISRDWARCFSDDLCLPNPFFCDGYPRCKDDSDEWTCNPSYCSGSSQRRCDNGQCYSYYDRCDGRFDCHDRSDEKNCSFCSFTCPDGICLQQQYLCDGNNDCGDPYWSDEVHGVCGNGTCASDQFECTDPPICIRRDQYCNGIMDCPDSSDETDGCGSSCRSDQFSCGERCISDSMVCDGSLNCLDGSDEQQDCSCPYGSYQCSNGECKPISTWCDAKYDCLDKSDDINDCQTVCPPRYSFCEADRKCVHEYDVCMNRSSCNMSSVEPAVNCSAIEIPEVLCGVPQVQPKTASPFVFGGEEAIPHSWPWTVSLQYGGRHWCGGSIVAPNWVLTAAHCVERSSNPSSYYILIGNHDQRITERLEKRINLRRIISHPFYDRSTIRNDIALLELDESITFNEHVQPVCVLRDDKPTGTMCTVIGWGDVLNTPGATTQLLNQAHLPIVDREVCRQRHVGVNPVDETMVCVGYDDASRGSCYGDSGGPLVCRHGLGYGLQGIVSWGISGCQRPLHPSVMARVPYFTEWIMQNTRNEVIPV